MLQKVKARCQKFLEGTERADTYSRVPLEIEPAVSRTERRPASRVGRPDPYAQLAPENLNREWETMGGGRKARILRAYEVGASPWVKGLLAELDEAMAKPLADMKRFVDRVHGRPVERRDWETPQYLRRHADAMAGTGELVKFLADGDVETTLTRIREARDRASSPEITGMIPVVTGTVEEEAWA
jgi:hypothetical protein